MNASRCSLFALGALALAGCATLEQAPLVYSSKTSVGVDISTTSTETPGLSMSVGFKQVDAAYVPVAVAKACQTEKNSAECDTELHRIQVVGGKEQLGDETPQAKPGDAAAVTETLRRQLDGYIKTAEKATADKNTYEQSLTQKKLLEVAWKKKNELKEESKKLAQFQTSANGTTTPPETITEQQKKVDALKLSQQEQDVTANINSESEYNQAISLLNIDALSRGMQESKRAADAQLELFKQTKEALTNRGDSYSVFGSFRGRTGVGAKNGSGAQAEVGLGKIFATGVASQKISGGLSEYYSNRSKDVCYRAVAEASIQYSINEKAVATLLKGCTTLSD